jgi:hypothetical protein
MAATATKKAAAPADDERRFHKLDCTKVRKDDILAIINYVKVTSVDCDGTKKAGTLLNVKNLDTDVAIKVEGEALIGNSQSADRYEEEVKVSQSEMIDLLMASYNRPLTVVYDKKDGSERTLRGRYIHPEARRGYSYVEDLDNPVGDRRRQVDHRTLKMLIVDGVKYVLKD